ncbi:hypothetical protein ACVBIL_19265 [Shewanella sp. 125m-7]
MEKLFTRKEKIIYSMTIGLSALFIILSSYRSATCGYDCGLFSVASGPTVIVVGVLSLWVFGISASIFLLKYLFRRFGKGET